MILKELFREDFEVFTLPEDSHISQAVDVMRNKQIGSILIVDPSGQILGVITDRDIALTLGLGVGTPDSYVSEIMSRDVETIPETMSLFEVSRFFRTVKVKRLPVVSKGGHLVGIVSMDDIMAFLARAMLDTCSSMESKLGHLV